MMQINNTAMEDDPFVFEPGVAEALKVAKKSDLQLALLSGDITLLLVDWPRERQMRAQKTFNLRCGLMTATFESTPRILEAGAPPTPSLSSADQPRR